MSDLEKLRESYEERMRDVTLMAERRAQQLVVLSEVAARVQGEEDEPAILDIALDEILKHLDLKTAWIFMGDERDGTLRLAADRGVAEAYLKTIASEGLGDCLCPEVFWKGHRMQARNTRQCPRMPGIVEGPPVAHACIPLKFEGSSRGVLNVAARVGEIFSEEDLKFLETLGNQICIAVEKARHLRAERAHSQEARAMAAISRAIGGSLDVEVALRAVGETAQSIVGADRVQVLLGNDPSSLKVAHLAGPTHPALREGERLDLEGIGAMVHLRAFREKRVVSCDNCALDETVDRTLMERWESASVLALPLFAREQPLGLLVLTNAAPRRWSESQIELAEALAAQASITLENARLYEEARRAYTELKKAQEQIIRNEKLAAIGTFASGLAHEVRNPLNSIGLQLSLLERRIARITGDTATEMRDLSQVIREEISRLEALVGDFLMFSQHHPQLRPTDLDLLVDEVLLLLSPEAETGGVTLRRVSDLAAPSIASVDAEKMKQVLINLVRNAIEAMPTGGAVNVETSIREDRAVISVCDTGPGLPEGLDIFQVFVSTKAKGTGLGLAIAQQIVTDHGGEIEAQSADPHGAIFRIALPLGRPKKGAAGA